MTSHRQRPWWADAVFYQVYPRSFADSDGDGVGDIDGVAAQLDYLDRLGVDSIWFSPIMVSPMADHGYDVSDPRDIDPLFGDLAAFEGLIASAHERGIKITMDLVPNHTSSEHPWFQEALAAAPGSAARDRYIFRDGRGPGGAEPPNNWQSVFGGPSWTRVVEPDGNPGQWYLHLFDVEQPDLNWDNPEVFDDLEKTLRFWLERGVDGFRIDVAHGMAKPPGLPDTDVEMRPRMLSDGDPRFNHPNVHAIHRNIRRVMDDYPEAVTIGEVWVFDNASWAEYLRADELHLGFNFRMVRAEFDITEIHDSIENTLAAAAIENATPTWTLENHDVVRAPSRYGGGEVGLDRARAMAMVTLALPGAVFLYNGQELGLAECRVARRGATRSDLGTLGPHRPRPRRMPHSDSVARRRSPVRFLHIGGHLVADAAGMGGADRGEAAGATPTRHCRSSSMRSKYGVAERNSRARVSSGWTCTATRWPSPAATTDCAACSTPASGRYRCRTAKSILASAPTGRRRVAGQRRGVAGRSGRCHAHLYT